MTFPELIISTERTKVFKFPSADEPLIVKVRQEFRSGEPVYIATSPNRYHDNTTYTSYDRGYPAHLSIQERMERTARGFEGQARDMYAREP